ncbi:hypothetical protein [Bradyrhizobium sp.]|uniref:hypothetical protein n=1 Tax=Bradyrhizobium sp. TaxID=376 RepID=UPI0023A4DFEE|nr:hypothetical protein [Bradyrhizobium sp.]MDE2376072.1 hypothetical protein [Bradyrhizobium sp.]
MTLAASFLGGAKSRLLPRSIPFRFFAAAASFHVLAWLVLLVSAGEATRFRGGLGPALAAVHLLTLGVLVTTAIGASVQLLPVATRRTMHAVWPIKLIFWLTVPGLMALVVGMYEAKTGILVPASAATAGGLLLFCGLLADNLRRAGSLPVVGAYGWAALVMLVLVIAFGVALSLDEERGFLPDHGAGALAHLILGGFGFMGMLALGFSHVLIPMFALASAPAKRPSLASFVAASTALVLGTLGALAGSRSLLTVAALVGLGAAALHLWLMHRVLKTGMRKRLGLSFVLIRAAWIMLPVTLVTGLVALYGLAGDNGGTLFGFLLLFGWLLTFLVAILQRIMPFLASMFVAPQAMGGSPIVSELANARSLRIHAVCHGVACAVLVVAILLENATLARLGSAVGLIGAIAFAWFTADAIRRIWPTS